MATYQTARQKLINRKTVLKRRVYNYYAWEFQREFNFDPDVSYEQRKDLLAQLCVRAASKVQAYCKSQGYNGWLYTTEEVRNRWALGFTSKGKKFRQRLYSVSALEVVMETKPSFVMIAGAAIGEPAWMESLANRWNWLRNHSKSQDRTQGRTRSHGQGQTGDWRQYHWWSGYTHPPSPPNPPPQSRENNWAYRGEAAIDSTGNWYDILAVDKSARGRTVRLAYRDRMRQVHTDVGGDKDEASRVNAAYRVYEKIFGKVKVDSV